MKERPILFSAPMVRALLDGRKTQTRRVMKPQPEGFWGSGVPAIAGGILQCLVMRNGNGTMREEYVRCPYGVPGDRLIFLTTWATDKEFNHLAPSKLPKIARIWSLFEGTKPEWCGRNRMGRFMPSVFRAVMPNGEITDVRVQRVQEISEEDSQAEGIRRIQHSTGPNFFTIDHGDYSSNRATAKECFQDLWNSINGKKHPWSSNCWVWAITFRRLNAEG